MDRVNLGAGRWFDRDAAERFEEKRHFDGQNFVSDATGDQFLHEELFRTRSGTWILHEWSQWQGGHNRHRQIDDARAQTWLIDNGHADAAERLFPGALAAAEI